MKYLDYFKEEEGKEVVDLNGQGFFTYILNNGEMFVEDLFILKEFRGGDAYRLMNSTIVNTAKELGAHSVTGTVYITNGDGDKFLKKLMFFHRLGFISSLIVNNSVIVVMDLQGG